MLIDYFFVVLSIVFCLPTSQLILDILDDHTDILRIFDTYGGYELLDWLRDGEESGPVALGIIYLCFCLGLYVASPLLFSIYTTVTVVGLSWSTHILNKKVDNLSNLIKTGGFKCHKHPNTTVAVCLELDGDIVTICPKCQPDKAKEYGIIQDNDE